jgi:dienelactone hydrolase
MRSGVVMAVVALLALAAVSTSPAERSHTGTQVRVWSVHYRSHGGVARSAYIVLPAWYGPNDNPPIPLVISPHGRGVSARANAALFGSLPARGSFGVISPEGQGRKLEGYSWGSAGQIDDLARMPAIVRAHGVNVDPHRIYAIGGSMGGQETLLLLARHPHLLAGAAAFDPDTDMARRYWDFADLPGGATLQELAREEIGGTPLTDPTAYAVRSPDTYARQIALSGVPLLLYWSTRDRVITDQVDETGALANEILGWNPEAPLTVFRGEWRHTAEMRWSRRLPGALVRFGLLSRDVAIQI